MAPVKFKVAQGDLMGLLMSPENTAIEWIGPGRILFSFCQRGKAISAHFAADRVGLRHLKRAIDDFCEWAFWTFDWCTMIMAIIVKPSVVRLVQKCGFIHIVDIEENKVYARLKWAHS